MFAACSMSMEDERSDIAPEGVLDFGATKRKMVRHVLGDYQALGISWPALVATDTPEKLKLDILAAVVGYQLGISPAYARKAYVSEEMLPEVPPEQVAYQEAYRAALQHVHDTIARLVGSESVPLGVFASSVALEKLRGTFEAAHLLYFNGSLFEGLAVSRLIVEQLAWATAVCRLESADDIRRIKPQSQIAVLKGLLPGAGRYYGSLSEFVHYDAEKHSYFLSLHSSGQLKLITAHAALAWSAGLGLLELADMFSIVFEHTQWDFMRSRENWTDRPRAVRDDRPFAKTAAQLRSEFEKLAKAPGR